MAMSGTAGKSAKQVFDEITAERQRLESYEDLRDDVMSLIKNSGVSFEDIHGRCGPHPHTLNNWAMQRVKHPQLGKLQSALRTIGYDLGIVEGRRARLATLPPFPAKGNL